MTPFELFRVLLLSCLFGERDIDLLQIEREGLFEILSNKKSGTSELKNN